MKIIYRPTSGFTIQATQINWGEDRIAVRGKIKIEFKEDNHIIDLPRYNNGDTSKNIEVRRDIYGSTPAGYYFFLNYNSQDKIESIEVHFGTPIQINDLELGDKEDINSILQKLDQKDSGRIDLDEGQFFYPNLKITVASNESMGGDGDRFSYFYAAEKVHHLIDDKII